MDGLIIIVIAILAIWFFIRKSNTEIYDATKEIRPWFISKNVKPSSVRHYVYDDPLLAKNHGASVMVGLAKKDNDEDVGFVIEVIPGQGVIEGIILQPSGTATYHKLESQYAISHGMSLLDRLHQKNIAAQQRNREAGHTEEKYVGSK